MSKYQNRSGGSRKAKQQYEHRMVAAIALGRPLPKGAMVHHVDGNGKNNAKGNLVLCQDQAYHMLLEVRTRTLRAGGNPNTDHICSACKRVQPLTKFTLRKTRSHGHAAGKPVQPCRECQ